MENYYVTILILQCFPLDTTLLLQKQFNNHFPDIWLHREAESRGGVGQDLQKNHRTSQLAKCFECSS